MTFSCVIEYGFVSFIHRYVERDKRKKAKKDSSPAKRQGNENDTSKPKLIIIPNVIIILDYTTLKIKP